MNKYVYMVYMIGSTGMSSLRHFSNKAKAEVYAEELRKTLNNDREYVNVNKMQLL